MEQQVVSGIAYAKDEAKITLLKVEDKPGIAARIFGPLAEASINVDMIVQNVVRGRQGTDMTFTVQAAELPRALDVLKAAKTDIGFFDVKARPDVAKISVIGIGMRSHAGVAAQMFKALAEKGINILAISDVRDQDQRVDRRCLRRACGPHLAHAFTVSTRTRRSQSTRRGGRTNPPARHPCGSSGHGHGHRDVATSPV